MAKGSTIQQVREICHCFYDENGNELDTPIGKVVDRKLPQENIDILKSMYNILFNSDMIHDETKEYLKKKYITMKGVNEIVNKRRELAGIKPVTLSSTLNKISRDTKVIEATFGADIILDLVYSRQPNIDRYRITINKNLASGGNKEIKDKFLIDIPDNIVETQCNDEDFDDFLDFLRLYVKKSAQDSIEAFDPSVIGYFNYIIASPYLTDKDIVNKEKILGMFNDDSYTVIE